MEIEETKTEQNNHLLTDQMKWMIIHYKTEGESNKKTAQEVGKKYGRPNLHPQTVNSIWLKYQETQSVENFWNMEGRPSVLEDKDKERLKRFFKRNPKKSINQAKAALNIPASRMTLNRHALAIGFQAYRAPKKIKNLSRQ